MKKQEKSAVKLQPGCHACGKPISASTERSMTSWLFRQEKCACSQPPVSASDVDSDGEDFSKDVELPQISERYEVLGLIGHGGMGEVFRVREKLTAQIMAAKVLSAKAGKDAEAIKRFEAEVRAVACLNHPNIVEVFDHGRTSDGAPYMVMSLIAGDNLSRYLKKNRKLEQSIALRLLIDIAEALSYAHKSGLLHRDLKPSNVIVTDAESSDTIGCRLVDFGIAKVMSDTQARDTQDLTKTGEVFGSPAYMSPEQCLGFKLDERSDIYSFGALMYEVLSGQPAINADNPVQAVVAQLKEKPKSWTNTPDGKPLKGLEAIAFRCLEKDKEERYQSVDELLKDLKLVAAGKQPAKFERQKTDTAVLSSGQAIVLIFDALVMFFYGAMITNGLTYAVLAVLATPIPIVMLVLHLKKHGAGGSDWSRWRLLFKATLVALGLTAIFLCTLILPFWDKASTAACWLYVTVFAVHMLLVNLALGISLGTFFLQDKSYNDWRCIGKQTILATFLCLLFGSFPIFYPAGSLPNSFNSSTQFLQLSESKPGVQMAMSQAGYVAGDKQDSARLIAAASRQLNEPEKSLPYLTDAIKAEPKAWNIYQIYIERARVYLALGNLPEALADANRAIDKDATRDTRAEALAYRGDVYKAMGKWQQAIDSYSQSIESTSIVGDPTGKRAYLYLKMGDWNKAIIDLTSRVEVSPSAENYLERAIAYEKSGDKKKADSDYRKVVSLLDNASFLKKPSSAYEEAFRVVFAPLIKKPIADALLVRSFAYQQLGEFDKSRLDFSEAMTNGGRTDGILKEFQKETGTRLEFDGKK